MHLSRLDAINERFPEFAEGWWMHVRALRRSGDSEAGELLAATCVELMPDVPELWLEYSRAAADQNAPERATLRLAQAAECCPDDPNIRLELGLTLSRLDRPAEADGVFRDGIRRFPEFVELACGYAGAAMRRHDLQEALTRWQLAQQRFPGNRRVKQGLLDAEVALSGDADVPLAQQASVKADENAGATANARLFWKFESLGGTGQGCEFGLVQSFAGAEPLGLLRWTMIEPQYLIEALESRFEGVGSEEQTEVGFFSTQDPGNPEYITKDRRLKTIMHTFVYKKDMPEEKMLQQTCRRLTFLRRKMIQDLEDGDKIFVYKIYQRNLQDEELARRAAELWRQHIAVCPVRRC
jgi:hypothetical protein